jgi:hypothetical protein
MIFYYIERRWGGTPRREVWSVGLQALLSNILNIHSTPAGRYLEWMQMDQSGRFLSMLTSHYNGRGEEGGAMGKCGGGGE